jgi:hypothetical protein
MLSTFVNKKIKLFGRGLDIQVWNLQFLKSWTLILKAWIDKFTMGPTFKTSQISFSQGHWYFTKFLWQNQIH